MFFSMEKDDEKPLNGQEGFTVDARIGVITTYVKRFTVYAIGYEDVKSKDDPGIDGENTAPITPTAVSPKTDDDRLKQQNKAGKRMAAGSMIT